MQSMEPSASNAYLLSLLVSQYPGSFLVTDATGKFLYVNDYCCELLNISREVLLGISIYDTLKGYCFATGASTIKTLETGVECLSTHTIGVTEKKQVLALSKPYFDEKGDISYVLTYSWDEKALYALLGDFDQEKKRMQNALHFLQKSKNAMEEFVAESDAMQELLRYVTNISAVDSTVIIYGESGSGKEMLANYVHKNSSRASQLFIPINCATFTPSLLEVELFGYEKGTFTGGNKEGKIGLFEFADKGTIFLDEIGEMPLELQSKLLRTLESGEFKRMGGNQIRKSNVRIIAATNRNLLEMVQEKTFRADLYYRLNVMVVNVPPLRSRIEDIQPLAEHFLNLFNKKYAFHKRFSPELLEYIKLCRWHGNVRELRNVVERMVVASTGNILTLRDLQEKESIPPSDSVLHMNVHPDMTYNDALTTFERIYIDSVLTSCNYNVKEAAKKMNLHISTLYRKLNS